MKTDQDTVIHSLVENALDFLSCAAEDVRKGHQRSLKASLSHLAASLELLLKARLCREHWSLVFKNVDEASKDSLSSGDFTSVDFKMATTRLRDIACVAIGETDLKHLRQLRKLRNRVLHFSVDVTSQQMKSLLAKGCDFALDFCKNHLTDEVDFNSSQITEVTENLRDFHEFVKERLGKTASSLEGAALVWDCPRCWQETLRIGNGHPTCVFCSYQMDAGELALKTTELGVEACPHCGEEACTLIILNNDEAAWYCLACGETDRDAKYNNCPRCQRLTVNDGMCDECWDELTNKD